MKIEGSQENIQKLMRMLAWIQFCGDRGHTCQWFKVGVDGDGAGRLRFEFQDKENQEKFKKEYKAIAEEQRAKKQDLKEISFE